MNVDKYGLPVQADGDANDQLQRVAMILSAEHFNHGDEPFEDASDLVVGCTNAIRIPRKQLQVAPGKFVRFIGADPASTSADQLISILAFAVCVKAPLAIGRMFARCLLRLGFAQNYRDTLDGSNKIKLPDFMLLRALPLFSRAHWSLYPLAVLSDVLLVGAAAAACGPVWRDGSLTPVARSADDVDDNVLILTLLACASRMPTPLSRLACFVYSRFRPWNYGCIDRYETGVVDPSTQIPEIEEEPHAYHPVIGALRWYHRTESGANPEIAEALIPAVKKYILREKT